MNPITTHRNPWTPHTDRMLWQVFSVDPGHTVDGFPITAAVCSHRHRNTAAACAWWRDIVAVINTRHAPRLSYSIRRTPNNGYRLDEENGVPCTTPDTHYCARLGLWLDHTTRPGDVSRWTR